jgi:hypothetical protein
LLLLYQRHNTIFPEFDRGKKAYFHTCFPPVLADFGHFFFAFGFFYGADFMTFEPIMGRNCCGKIYFDVLQPNKRLYGSMY